MYLLPGTGENKDTSCELIIVIDTRYLHASRTKDFFCPELISMAQSSADSWGNFVFCFLSYDSNLLPLHEFCDLGLILAKEEDVRPGPFPRLFCNSQDLSQEISDDS